MSATGAFAPGYAVLTLTYTSAAYLAVITAAAILSCVREGFKCIPAFASRSQVAKRGPIQLARFIACAAVALYLVPLASEYTHDTIGTDVYFAANMADARTGEPIDPTLAEDANYGDIGFAFALSATPRRCVDVSLDDRTIVLSANRVAVIPALVEGTQFEGSITWPVERLRVVGCIQP